jgi:hypothetical protein
VIGRAWALGQCNWRRAVLLNLWVGDGGKAQSWGNGCWGAMCGGFDVYEADG